MPDLGWIQTSAIEAVTICSSWEESNVLLHTKTANYVYKQCRTKDDALSEAEKLVKLIMEEESTDGPRRNTG